MLFKLAWNGHWPLEIDLVSHPLFATAKKFIILSFNFQEAFRMEDVDYFVDKLKSYGVGRRKLDDILFVNDKPPPRLGVYDFDEENYCHEV